MADAFDFPNFHQPLAWRDEIAAAPPDVGVRGVFFNTIADELLNAGHDEKRRLAFKLYPLAEFMEFEVRAAGLLHPGQPLREGLRRLGRLSYPSLMSTTAGRVLFSVAGLDFRIALTLASKAYALSMTHGSCELRDLQKNRADVVLKEVYNFVDCFQVGVFEGAMNAFNVSGPVLLGHVGRGTAELHLEWQ